MPFAILGFSFLNFWKVVRLALLMLAMQFIFIDAVQAQIKFGWRSPVDHPIALSGTFGELRARHFHHGLDIKSSKGVVGDPIYAIGDGKLHRLRVQAGGYGLSIYIKHPEGYVSVYGHLSKHAEKFADMIRMAQQEQAQFEVDLLLDSLQMEIKKGDIIGQMGNSGFSFGPHLHFEIRDAQSEKIINPMHFGFLTKDRKHPVVKHLITFGYDETGYYLGSLMHALPKNEDTLWISQPRIGLGIEAYDAMSAVRNHNGLYLFSLMQDSAVHYYFKADSTSFQSTNAASWIKANQLVQKEQETIYRAYVHGLQAADRGMLQVDQGGLLDMTRSKIRHMQIRVCDFNKNCWDRSFFLARKPNNQDTLHASTAYFPLAYDEPNIIALQEVQLECDRNTFFEKQKLSVHVFASPNTPFHGNAYNFVGNDIPFYGSCELIFSMDSLNAQDSAKAVIISCTDKELHVFGSEKHEGFISAPIDRWGTYGIYIDHIPPEIEALNFTEELKVGSKYYFRIEDQLVSKFQAAELRYNAQIDGKWVLMEFDLKKNKLSFEVPPLNPGEHIFELYVEDLAGNSSNYTNIFLIK